MTDDFRNNISRQSMMATDIRSRFFKNELPEVDDVVMAKFVDKDDYGYHVKLLEYGDIDGFINHSEMSKKRWNKKKNLAKPGEIAPVSVMSVDGNNITLSKRRVSVEEAEEAQKHYEICSSTSRLCDEVYKMHQMLSQESPIRTPDRMREETLWRLYEEYDNDYEQVYQTILRHPSQMFSSIFNPEEVQKISGNIRNRLTEEYILTETRLNILSLDGVDRIKEALDVPLEDGVKITALTSPIYVVSVSGSSMDSISQTVDSILDLIKANAVHLGIKMDVITRCDVVKHIQRTIRFLNQRELEQLSF